jgi:hypothetical protein
MLIMIIVFFSTVLPKLKQDSITPQEKLEMLKFFLGVRTPDCPSLLKRVTLYPVGEG